ncbi:uncharacterized protein SPPG_01858 [Spizellomyces punctatus DAOM BR117]|uniref:Zinc finger PHD-type domain-containing protein n=1 Tax=Spizellomyces punctatus (strain DAOM BR117) TaxID=645134 RepID=A0A0L0HNV6_SPIPD|nr:uncharacterized protein SPPG_01858 [Spizellomyces punctatus DAOM BR117]KND02777.1 hypothetical protein SPPG_01858 [Spizellomyces punctatus DAOM BR117]|eukprot:XP_016610816.1 hypothetical protein SPPG_01858 [Spizellomyces punctatus DAOM BR117]
MAARGGGVSRANDSAELGDTEDDEVTRCVCGRTESFGVMVQCEDCFVWQHCECMNVNPRKLPKHYYCERCQPGHHQHSTTRPTSHRTSRDRPGSGNGSAVGGKPTPKKRNTMNSLEAAQPYTELLMFKPGDEPNPDDSSGEVGSHENDVGNDAVRRRSSHDVASVEVVKELFSESTPLGDIAFIERRTIEVEQVGVDPAGIDQTQVNLKRKREQVSHPIPHTPDEEKDTNIRVDVGEICAESNKSTTELRSPLTNGRNSSAEEGSELDAKTKRTKGENGRRNASQPNTRNGKVPRPQRMLHRNSANREAQHHSQPTPASSGHAAELDAGFSVKVRIPHAKATLGEMNKRVKQLSDYITRLQVSMATEPKLELSDSSPELANHPDAKPRTPPAHITSPAVDFAPGLVRSPEEVSSGSLPNGSHTSNNGSENVKDPLLRENELPTKEETSLEMLDRLNRALIKFQERFGSQTRR